MIVDAPGKKWGSHRTPPDLAGAIRTNSSTSDLPADSRAQRTVGHCLSLVFSDLCDLYKNEHEGDFPFLHALIDVGAQGNAHRILEDVAETNTNLVSTLMGMGVHANGGWHFRRQMMSSPLHGCANSMIRDVFEILVENGANVYWVDWFGVTPTMD